MVAMKELCGGPWVTGGDFNIVRRMGERRGCNRVTNIMNEFSKWIDELELHDPHLSGRKFTWFRGDNHPSAARLDRFLYSMSSEENFKSIKQSTLPRVRSNHNPIILDSVKRLEQEELLRRRKNCLLEELTELDRIQNDRILNDEEMVIKTTILVELEVLAKQEEASWRQKSRLLWLKQGDKNTRFFQRQATAHRRYNTIDRLVVRGVEIQEPTEVKEAMIDFYAKLYSETESWRPSFDFVGCPTVSTKENE
ncbi:hypothetical protein H5410_039872, partial [Solanum commersonii]